VDTPLPRDGREEEYRAEMQVKSQAVPGKIRGAWLHLAFLKSKERRSFLATLRSLREDELTVFEAQCLLASMYVSHGKYTMQNLQAKIAPLKSELEALSEIRSSRPDADPDLNSDVTPADLSWYRAISKNMQTVASELKPLEIQLATIKSHGGSLPDSKRRQLLERFIIKSKGRHQEVPAADDGRSSAVVNTGEAPAPVLDFDSPEEAAPPDEKSRKNRRVVRPERPVVKVKSNNFFLKNGAKVGAGFSGVVAGTKVKSAPGVASWPNSAENPKVARKIKHGQRKDPPLPPAPVPRQPGPSGDVSDPPFRDDLIFRQFKVKGQSRQRVVPLRSLSTADLDAEKERMIPRFTPLGLFGVDASMRRAIRHRVSKGLGVRAVLNTVPSTTLLGDIFRAFEYSHPTYFFSLGRMRGGKVVGVRSQHKIVADMQRSLRKQELKRVGHRGPTLHQARMSGQLVVVGQPKIQQTTTQPI
jgi:hypothetical protein